MGSRTLFEEIKCWVGSWAFRLFLWSVDRTAEQYFYEIYQQEKMFIDGEAKR